MGGAYARGWRGDPLAHAFGVDRERGRVLENARAGRFRQFGQAQGVVERMDVECARQMHGMEVVIGLENVPHPLRRPYLDFSAELLCIELRIIQEFVAVIDLGRFEPAGDRRNSRQASLSDRGANVFEAHLGERPQRLGVLQTDTTHHAVHRRGKAGQHEAIVTAGRAPCDAPALEHRDRPPASSDLAGGRQPRKAGADDTHVNIEIVGKRRARGCRHHGGRIPSRHVGCWLRCVHVFFHAS